MARLVTAAQAGDLDNLRHLLDEEKAQNPDLGKDGLNFSTSSMQDACRAAAQANQPAALSLVLDSGGNMYDGRIAAAAASGHSKDVFDLLISRGWDVNANTGHTGDALIMCVGANYQDMVEFLLSRGADPNRNVAGDSSRAIELGACSASIPTLEALLNAGAELTGRSALSNAAGKGRSDIVAYLLDRGAGINEIPDNTDINNHRREYGLKNALCEAAWKGQPTVMELLLRRGADPSVKDSKGRTAMELAQLQGNGACVGILNRYAGE